MIKIANIKYEALDFDTEFTIAHEGKAAEILAEIGLLSKGEIALMNQDKQKIIDRLEKSKTAKVKRDELSEDQRANLQSELKWLEEKIQKAANETMMTMFKARSVQNLVPLLYKPLNSKAVYSDVQYKKVFDEFGNMTPTQAEKDEYKEVIANFINTKMDSIMLDSLPFSGSAMKKKVKKE